MTPDQYLVPNAQYASWGIPSGKYYSWISSVSCIILSDTEKRTEKCFLQGGSSGVNFILGQKFLENYVSFSLSLSYKGLSEPDIYPSLSTLFMTLPTPVSVSLLVLDGSDAL